MESIEESLRKIRLQKVKKAKIRRERNKKSRLVGQFQSEPKIIKENPNIDDIIEKIEKLSTKPLDVENLSKRLKRENRLITYDEWAEIMGYPDFEEQWKIIDKNERDRWNVIFKNSCDENNFII